MLSVHLHGLVKINHLNNLAQFHPYRVLNEVRVNDHAGILLQPIQMVARVNLPQRGLYPLGMKRPSYNRPLSTVFWWHCGMASSHISSFISEIMLHG